MESLDTKLSNIFGRMRRHHSIIKYDPIHPTVVLRRPGKRGFYTMNTVNPKNGDEVFEVIQDGILLGRMNYRTIVQKFGRRF